MSQTVSVLALFYGTASNPALQSIPAARSLSSYDWSCQELTQSDVDAVVNAMHTDMVAKADEKCHVNLNLTVLEHVHIISYYVIDMISI